MTPDQIMLVRQSFTKVLPIRDAAAALFYDRLFTIDPSTRPMFRGDLKAQGAKLMAAIGAVVRSLDRLDAMLPTIRDLARRHTGYGVRDEHYASVGSALLWTLEQGLGADFTPAVRDAWATAYGVLSTAMIEAASEPLPSAA
jgi:hemoglobin-like flavoprotein